MKTINPNPGDGFCDLSEEELLTELARGIARAVELEEELQAAHSHAWLASDRLRGLRKAEVTA